MKKNHYECIIIGGGIAGLITAQILGRQGFHTLLLERASELGGKLTSFELGGYIFDHGYHTLDHNRSRFATKFFEATLDGKIRKILLERGIVIRGQLIPYNAPLDEWPKEISSNFEKREFIDNIDGLADREAVREIYGSFMAGLAFDEIMPSYRTLNYLRNEGYPEGELSDLVYPWYFPRPEKCNRRTGTEWNTYHDKIRQSGRHEVLYPAEGGFGTFMKKLVEKIDTRFVTLKTGVQNSLPDFDIETRRFQSIEVDGETCTADQYFWCAPVFPLIAQLGFEIVKGTQIEYALGHFVFDQPVDVEYHELLIGDPDFPVNRISFPGLIAGTENCQIQTEVSFSHGELKYDDEQWKDIYLDCFRKLGFIGSSHQIKHFRLDHNIWGRLVPLRTQIPIFETYKEALDVPETNICYPFIAIGPENMNRMIPGATRKVYEAISQL